MLGIFACSADFVFLFKKCTESVFQELHKSFNSLDPDKARRFAMPDLGPNCLQKPTADDNCRI